MMKMYELSHVTPGKKNEELWT